MEQGNRVRKTETIPYLESLKGVIVIKTLYSLITLEVIRCLGKFVSRNVQRHMEVEYMFETIFRTAKRMVPSPIKDILIKIINRFLLPRQVRFEIKRLKRFAYRLNGKNDIHNLFAQLTLFTHAIEKGLSNPTLRLGFGQSAIKSLKEVMIEYKDAGHPLDEERFLSAFIVLQEYCKIHTNSPEYTSNIYEFLSKFEINPPILRVGAVEHRKGTILEKSKSTFSELALNRISVRDYSTAEVDENLVYNSIDIAMKSPSVCNRQSWRVHLIKDDKLLAKILALQGGLQGNGANLRKLILVSIDLRYFSCMLERNQGYIDGGIFLMSLVYALTYNEVATCILNAIFDRRTEDEIRAILGIEESEILIGFIALGNYPDKFKAPASLRDSSKKCIIIH